MSNESKNICPTTTYKADCPLYIGFTSAGNELDFLYFLSLYRTFEISELKRHIKSQIATYYDGDWNSDPWTNTIIFPCIPGTDYNKSLSYYNQRGYQSIFSDEWTLHAAFAVIACLLDFTMTNEISIIVHDIMDYFKTYLPDIYEGLKTDSSL